MQYSALFAIGLVAAAFAQDISKPEPKSVTVPITIDHNRVVIDVLLTLPDGSSERVRGWVDNGNPDLCLSQRVAKLLGLAIKCDGQSCTAKPPREIAIGTMRVSLAAVEEAKIPLKPDNAASVMEPGMNAEINIPSSVLRNYDVLINFPGRELSIGVPGSLKFLGTKAKMLVNANNGLIQIPSKLESKSCNLALDIGASISFLSEEWFEKLSASHPDWPHMNGGVGPANMWGADNEAQWKVMRVDRIQYGPLYLIDVAVVEFPKDWTAFFEKRAGIPTAGLLGSSALMNYRVGLDYAHSLVYFDIGRMFQFPEFDVVGLTLRPDDDGRFTIIGISDFESKPSVPEVQEGDHLAAVDGISVTNSTMGQVWSMLRGTPGQERKLTVERGGKQFTVVANVRHFLAAAPDQDEKKRSSRN